MYAQLDQQQLVPAIWSVVEEEDWSGVNDCGAIHRLDLGAAISPIDADIDWPIEQCS